MHNLDCFDIYLKRWNVRVAGKPFTTRTSELLPVLLTASLDGCPAMIKTPRDMDERIGGQVLQWWDGGGAARVYAYDRDSGALLMERATGSRCLLRMAAEGEDDDATNHICQTIHQLHLKKSPAPREKLLSLTEFFSSLTPMAQREGGLMAERARVANELLSDQREHVILHGDAHHSNILDFNEWGWLAHAALSAAWFLEDGEREQADGQLVVAYLARQMIG